MYPSVLRSCHGRLASMSESDSTRREFLSGMAAVPLLPGALQAEAAASSLCFMSTVEMARLIRTKKLSAREALAVRLDENLRRFFGRRGSRSGLRTCACCHWVRYRRFAA